MQKVLKPNFAAAWEEIGESNELEDTYGLSSMKSVEGWFTTLSLSLSLSLAVRFNGHFSGEPGLASVY